ncbi:MAG: insulinase family protein, partial [Thermoanaerobaculia bacterium]
MPERTTAREAPALRVRQVPGAPVVVVRVALAGGARRESIPGLALVTGRSLDEGTRRRDYRQLAAAAEALGMNACGYCAFEQIGITVDALAADWRAAIDLAAEMTFEPAFPEERIAFVARQAAAELEAQADDAEVATARAFADLLYAPHPKGRPLQGDAASLARLTGEQCAAFHAASLARGGVVVVAGDFDEEPVRSHLAAAFAA